MIAPSKVNVELNGRTAPLIMRDLRLWCNYASGGKWQPYPHASIICKNLQRVMDPSDDLKRLIIQMPPRHGKTYPTSVLGPCFFLGHFPDKWVQVVTHTEKYSEQNGGAAKLCFNQYGKELFGLEVSRESAAKTHWKIRGHHGGLNAVGLNGNILGQGADLLIIDDPYSSLEDALSPAKREGVWDTYSGTLRSRLHNNAGIIIIHQRAHPDDLIGRILRLSTTTDEHWEVVTLKGIAQEDEYVDGELFRRAGEPLCEELQSLELLKEHQATMSRFQWSAHYDQDPVAPEGAFWDEQYFPDNSDTSCYVDVWPEKVDHLVVAVDPSMGKNSREHDFQAVVALGTNGDGLFYVDAWIEKANVNQLCQNICDFVQAKLPRTCDVIGVEDEAAQELMMKPLVDTLRSRQIWTSTAPINNGKVNKKLRVRRIDPWITNHRMRFVRSKGTTILVSQLKEFPCKQSHDDGPDALEMAFSLLATTAA